MTTKRKGKKETKQESSTQYKVVDPVSLADLENIHTRKGKYPTRPPPYGQMTWEEAKRDKEEKLKKLRKERSSSTPLETTSTEVMDTEPSMMSRSVPATLQQNKEKEGYGGARPKIPSTNKMAFQDYTPEMMWALNNPWKPKGRKTITPDGAKIAPLVYLSINGTPVEGQSIKEEGNEKSVGINMSALDKTELVPYNLSQVKNPVSPVEFTKEEMNGAALRVEPKELSLLKILGFEGQGERNLEPDFYMPDGKGRKLSDTHCMYTCDSTPEGNPGVAVRLENLGGKYGTTLYLLDKRSGNLYVLEAE